MFRFLDPANLISLLGFCLALAGVLLAMEGQGAYGLSCLVGAGLCDTFDGAVARRLTRDEQGRLFGQRLDSLVDVGAFAVAPPLVLYGLGLQSPPELAILALFACCAVWRLAYFDTVGLTPPPEGGRPCYTGLPVTFSGLALPIGGLAGFHSARSLRISEAVIALGLSALMVSPLQIPKPGAKVSVPLGILGVAVATVFLVSGADFPRAG